MRRLCTSEARIGLTTNERLETLGNFVTLVQERVGDRRGCKWRRKQHSPKGYQRQGKQANISYTQSRSGGRFPSRSERYY